MRRNREATEKAAADLESAPDCGLHAGHNLPDMQGQESGAVALREKLKRHLKDNLWLTLPLGCSNGEKVIRQEG